jgi:hypothetical protein
VEFKWVPIDGLFGVIHPERNALTGIIYEELSEMNKKGII